jgi:hypothetical protein
MDTNVRLVSTVVEARVLYRGNHLRRIVCRRVVGDEDFDIGKGLVEDTADRLCEQVGSIEGWDRDRQASRGVSRQDPPSSIDCGDVIPSRDDWSIE